MRIVDCDWWVLREFGIVSCSWKDFLTGVNGGNGESRGLDPKVSPLSLFSSVRVLGFVRAEYFFFFLVRRNSIDFVAPRVLQVVGGLEVREWLVRYCSWDFVAGGATKIPFGWRQKSEVAGQGSEARWPDGQMARITPQGFGILTQIETRHRIVPCAQGEHWRDRKRRRGFPLAKSYWLIADSYSDCRRAIYTHVRATFTPPTLHVVVGVVGFSCVAARVRHEATRTRGTIAGMRLSAFSGCPPSEGG